MTPCPFVVVAAAAVVRLVPLDGRGGARETVATSSPSPTAAHEISLGAHNIGRQICHRVSSSPPLAPNSAGRLQQGESAEGNNTAL